MCSWCIWNTNALYQRVLQGGFIFLERITWVHIHYAFLVLFFFPKEQTICWLQTCPIIPVALHLSSRTVWFSNLSSFFIGRVFFLHLMSFSSEYFRWYKTTCSQNAFLGNYGNSIYFKIGLGFFFSRPLRCASQNSIRYCCSEEFLTRVENWFKVVFSFVTLYNELKSVD